MEEKILESIKILLGISETDINFDQEIMMHINSVFMVLHQLGVGTEEVYKISTGNEEWSDFFEDSIDLDAVKSYIFLKVRLIFDPPQNSFLVKAIEDQIKEYSWRLHVQTEPYTLTAEDEAEDAA